MQDILAHLLVVVNNGKTYYCRIFICCLMLYALSDEIVNADFFSFSDVKSSETSSVAGYVSVNDFGAIADAKKVNGKWVGTDNSVAFNKALKSCRKSGLTLFIPKGNYGVASTIWLTNPDIDGLAQSSVTVVGSNRGAYTKQGNCAKICVLENFNKGTLINVKKEDGSNIREPDIKPVVGISNGRQVHIQGISIEGNSLDDFICGIAIGNISKITSLKNCSFYDTYAGIVITGIRSDKSKNVIEGNNDLLLVEQCTFNNSYNIVCGGTQPYCCEYRSNIFYCKNSIFTGNLITNKYGQSRGSHKFSSNIFETNIESQKNIVIYFDLAINDIVIDSCHFETGNERFLPEVLIRCQPEGGVISSHGRISLTNNIINFQSLEIKASIENPLIDTMVDTRMILQGNSFHIAAPVRIKAKGAILIGNIFKLSGNIKRLVTDEVDIEKIGSYDFNHFIRADSTLKLSLVNDTVLKIGRDYRVHFDMNVFEITEKGKELIGASGSNIISISYIANDSNIAFQAWYGNEFNPPGWKSEKLTLIANKVIYKSDSGDFLKKEIESLQQR